MRFGYGDESGEPGIKKNNNDFFVFCLVLIENREKSLAIANAIKQFRAENGLPDDYEFHYVDNSKKVRAAFIDFIKKLDFEFVSVSIKKNNLRSYASVRNMSEMILELIGKHGLDVSVEMDKNPLLYKELRQNKRKYHAVLRCVEKESRGHDLIQLADYVTALRTRVLKYPDKAATKDAYKNISKKMLDQINI